MEMHSPTRCTPPSSSNPFEGNYDEYTRDDDSFFEWIECDDFWWDEEERHKLF